MKKGEVVWIDKIIITRDEVSKQPKVVVEGLWNGKERRMISRMLLKQMRIASNQIKRLHKQADLLKANKKVDDIKEIRSNALVKARAAKKAKKELKEEELENVRGQRKSE